MLNELFFDMGEYRAVIPTDRMYAKNHMWVAKQTEYTNRWRFGFSSYAVRLLQDVYFLDWIIEEGTGIENRQEIGQIESKKAEASLYAPASGKLLSFNPMLLQDPSAINVEPYASGWLFEMECREEPFLSSEAYYQHLVEVWEVTQRTIKGQLNE